MTGGDPGACDPGGNDGERFRIEEEPDGDGAAGEGFPVAILNRNEPAFYYVPAKAYEALMDRLEDVELNALADARLNDGQAIVKVSLDEL